MFLIWGLCLFGTALLIHVIHWRIYFPANYSTRLIFIFLITLVLCESLAYLAQLRYGDLGLPTMREPAKFILLNLLYGSLSIFYTFFHVCLIFDSPTLLISSIIDEAGEAGLPVEYLIENLARETMVEERLDTLIADRMIEFRDEKYHLLPRGLRLLNIISAIRKLFNLGYAGG